MTINKILHHFNTENDISADTITALQNNDELREQLIAHSRQTKDRQFALALLNHCMAIRKQPEGMMSAEDLMLACFNLGLHGQIEDCLKIWEAKTIDFDTYCGLDIQLVPFAGVDKTIEYLKLQTSAEAKKALEYVEKCAACGDFDDLHDYHSPDSLPWFV